MLIVPLTHKAAGHDGPMQTVDGSLFIKPSTAQEIEFYNQAQEKRMHIHEDVSYGEQLADWMPEYVGALYPGASDDLLMKSGGAIDESTLLKATDTAEIEGNRQYLVLGNCLHGFQQPSIIDIKLGSILYDESASPEKVERMKNVSRTTTSGSLQFRIAGMVIKDDFNGEMPTSVKGINMPDVCLKDKNKGCLTFNKDFGRKLTTENVQQGLELFFRYNKLPRENQNQLIETFHARLQMLYNCLLGEEIRVVSGSLLFVYENDLSRWEASDYFDPILNPPTIFEEEDEDAEMEEDMFQRKDTARKGIEKTETAERLKFIEQETIGEIEVDEEETEEEEDEKRQTPLSTLKLIDFAHAKYTPHQGYDEEVVAGVENIFNILEKMLQS